MKRIDVTFLMAFLTIFLLAFFFVNKVDAAFSGYISDCLGVTTSHHTATLTIKPDGKMKPQADTDTYIFVCITGSGLTGTKCTTGIANVDDTVFGKHDDLSALKGKFTDPGDTVGGVDGGVNPKMTNNDGTALTTLTTWTDIYHPAVLHEWSWLQEYKGGLGGAGNGDVGAQQQGTFDFVKLNAEKNCAKIWWDPRGYVFEAATLNPVKDISVMLSKGPKGGTFTDVPGGLGITNPDTTRSTNGQYSFYVEPGFYKLRITSSNATIAELATVNSNYQELFLSEEGKTNIYQENQEVEEKKGMVAIANIPVIVTDPALLITSLQILENGISESGGQINIFGRVSHPKSKMILTMNLLDRNGSPVNLVGNDVTNDLGEYDKYINQEQVDAGGNKLQLVNLNVSFELNSFYTTGTFSKNENMVIGFVKKLWNYIFENSIVSASTSTSYNVKPIPTYIEGIAYDLNGRVIPGAIVGVYTTFSNKPMAITVADQEGIYKIGSQHLPRFAYELRYKKPTGEVVVVDTSTFIKQNATFFATEGIKPFAEKKTTLAEDKKVNDFLAGTNTSFDLTPTVGGQKNSANKYTSGGSSKSSSSRYPSGNTTQTEGGVIGAGMQGVVMILVVIMILIMVGVGAFIMMKSKQQSTPQF